MGWLTIVELHRSVPFPGHVVVAGVVVVAVIDSLAWRIKADGQVRLEALGPFDRNEYAKDVRRLDTLDEVLAAVAPDGVEGARHRSQPRIAPQAEPRPASGPRWARVGWRRGRSGRRAR